MKDRKINVIALLITTIISLPSCGMSTNDSIIDNSSTSIEDVTDKAYNNEEDVINFIDQDNIKISLESKEDRGTGLALVILIENNSERDISVRTDNYSVNDYMIKGSDTESVLPGKKNHIEIFIFDSDLSDLKIREKDPYEFDFKIKVNDKNDQSWSIETEEITLNINS